MHYIAWKPEPPTLKFHHSWNWMAIPHSVPWFLRPAIWFWGEYRPQNTNSTPSWIGRSSICWCQIGRARLNSVLNTVKRRASGHNDWIPECNLYIFSVTLWSRRHIHHCQETNSIIHQSDVLHLHTVLHMEHSTIVKVLESQEARDTSTVVKPIFLIEMKAMKAWVGHIVGPESFRRGTPVASDVKAESLRSCHNIAVKADVLCLVHFDSCHPHGRPRWLCDQNHKVIREGKVLTLQINAMANCTKHQIVL